MTKVELIQNKPSDEVVAKCLAEVTITDPRGRKLTLQKPGVLAQFRLVEALGDTAKNEVYMAMVLPMIFITKIDGEAVFLPNTKRELEALIQRLDEDGVTCVVNGVQENFGKSNPETDKENLKN